MEKSGCFVFHLEGTDRVPIRSQPSTSDENIRNISFAPNELISVDLIRVVNEADTFLRLTDGTGWILHNEDILKPLHVESDLYVLVVDHYPAGLTARSNPNERDDFRIDNVFYRPLEKLFCDKKITHPETGCNFYRVQGTSHWVFDRKYDAERKAFDATLLEDHHVNMGDFAYIASTTVAIRGIPSLNHESKTGLEIRKGEMIIVNVIRDSPHGPWLRLSCGTGWVPEACGRKTYFEQLVLERSSWSFRILNHPIGIQLRVHPLDERDEKLVDRKSFDDRLQLEFPKLPVLVEPETIVDCDCKLVSPSTGVSWYRVIESKGWIFDRRNGKATIETYKRSGKRIVDTAGAQWSVEFLRGMATMIEGLQEVRHNDMDYVILFQKEEVQIKIWYKLRTVSIYVDRSKQGRIQISHKDCSQQDIVDILKDPRRLLMDKTHGTPDSPRSATDFFDRSSTRERRSKELAVSSRIPVLEGAKQSNSAVMKYGARYYKPYHSKMGSMDESQIAIKGRRKDGGSQAPDESSLIVKAPSFCSSAASLDTVCYHSRLRPRAAPHSVTSSSIVIKDHEYELDCRQRLLSLEVEIQFLLEERRHLVDALRTCDLRRSCEAIRLQQQSEGFQRKLQPLLAPGLLFWGPTFGVWRCEKCREECSDRQSLTQHAESSGH